MSQKSHENLPGIVIPLSTAGELHRAPRPRSLGALFFMSGWHLPSFLIGIGEALMMFAFGPRLTARSDVDAISADMEKVLLDFAAVLKRHGHILDASRK